MYFTDKNDFLAHYGVIGMKWGVRHDRKNIKNKYIELLKDNPKKARELGILKKRDAKRFNKLENKVGRKLKITDAGPAYSLRYRSINKSARNIKKYDSVLKDFNKIKKNDKTATFLKPGLYDKNGYYYEIKLKDAKKINNKILKNNNLSYNLLKDEILNKKYRITKSKIIVNNILNSL